MRLDPRDAGGVDVTAVNLRLVGFVEEMAQEAARPAAEVQDPRAAREAARESAVEADPSAPRRVALAGSGLEGDRLDVAVSGRGGPGTHVRVEVEYRAPTRVPLIGAALGDVTLQASATMRVER